MRRLAGLSLALFLALGGATAFAVQPDEVLADPRLETRARALSAELRCMVCQNQSIDDSDAALAKDLRIVVRERLVAGDSDREVLDYLVARYGQFVLLRPRFETQTLVLWATPVAILLAGAGFLLLSRRRARAAPGAPLSTEEEEAVARALRRLDR